MQKYVLPLFIMLSAATISCAQSTQAPNVKPQNGLIAFTLYDKVGHQQIFTQKPDGTDRHQLTFEGDNGRADWSPDGNRIIMGHQDGRRHGVAIMDGNGSNWKYLADGSNDPDWSPDGKTIAFSRPSKSDGGQMLPQIWLMDADGGNLRQLTTSNTAKNGPSWSPDGKQMVFINYRNPGSPSDPQPQIGIMNSDGSNERLLTIEQRLNVKVDEDGISTLLETAYDANAPSWSPVDNRVAFWSGLETQYGQIWVINSDGTNCRQLTEDPSHRSSDDPSWSPDGTKILFNTGRSGHSELWVMNSDGSDERRVSDTDPIPCPGRGAWQPVIEGVTKTWADHPEEKSHANSESVVGIKPVAPVITRTNALGVYQLSGDTLTKLSLVTAKKVASIQLKPKKPMNAEANQMQLSAMLITAEKVIVLIGQQLYVVNAASMKVIMTAKLPASDAIGASMQPAPKLALQGNVVYVSLGARSVAINTATGAVVGSNMPDMP